MNVVVDDAEEIYLGKALAAGKTNRSVGKSTTTCFSIILAN